MNLKIKNLKNQLIKGNTHALDLFREMLRQQGAPLIESIDENPQKSYVTFIYESDKPLKNVLFDGGFIDLSSYDPKDYIMENIHGTNIWYRTFAVKNDLKFFYFFYPDDSLNKLCDERWTKMQWDKYNSSKIVYPGNEGEDDTIISHYLMPYAERDTWLTPRTDKNRGELHEYNFESSSFKKPRKIQIYIPFGYDPHKEYGYVLFSDGSEYTEILSAHHALDNLIAEDKISPTIGIFINSEEERFEELTCNDDFCNIVVNEILPWVKSMYSLSLDPSKAVTCGLSLGGLTATYMGLKYSNIFGKVLSQSASFWYNPDVELDLLNSDEYVKEHHEPWMSLQFKRTSRLPVKFYFNAGELEGDRMIRNINHVKDTLVDLDYEVHFEMFKSGHDYLSWGQTFATGMIMLNKSEKNT